MFSSVTKEDFSNHIYQFFRKLWERLVEGKFKIEQFDGDISITSTESICINDDEEENSDIEHESISVIDSDSDSFLRYF